MKKKYTLAAVGVLVAIVIAGGIYLGQDHNNIASNKYSQKLIVEKPEVKLFNQLKDEKKIIDNSAQLDEAEIQKIVSLYNMDLLNNPIEKFSVDEKIITIGYKYDLDEFKQMKKEANQILKNFKNTVKRHRKEIQVLRAYQFVSQRMAYDENSDLTPIESFLSETTGDSKSFAVLFNKCLELLDVESYYAWDLSTTHVWNIAYIDDEPLHFDTTYEAAGYEGLFFINFGMSDKTRSESSYLEDWVVGHSRDFLIKTPACTDDRFEFLYNSYGTYLDAPNKLIYYIEGTDASKLIVYDFRTREHFVLDDRHVILLCEYQGDLYYLDSDFTPYKYNIERQSKSVIRDGTPGYGFHEEEGVFYLITLDDELIKIK